jgi:release factor glutamine methyltransferase
VSSTHPDGAQSVLTIRQLVASASTELPSTSEALWIVAEAAAIAPATIMTVLDTRVTSATVDAVQAMVERRTAGEPLQYVLGTWSFRHLEVGVDPRALIPRPETEQVVETALDELGRIVAEGSAPERLLAVDLGTGSGVIALSLAQEGPDVARRSHSSLDGLPGAIELEVWGTDVSVSALDLARLNLSRLADACADADVDAGAAARLHLVEGSWFDALPSRLAGQVHLVVSNPPYVSAAEWSALEPEVRDHEPRTALVPGESGLEAFDVLVDQGRRWLAPRGALVVELAPHQAATVVTMAETAGYTAVRIFPDLAGRDRILVAVWPDG